jgi:hypothetical protein
MAGHSEIEGSPRERRAGRDVPDGGMGRRTRERRLGGEARAMRRTILFLALMLAAAPAGAETDTPVTMERRDGPVTGEEHRVDPPGAERTTPHGTVIEWRRPVEVRVRAVSGLPLTREEQDEVRALAVACDDGGASENLFVYVEPDNTVVLSFDCVSTE